MELKKGMYVRTTYGIGKITDMNIIYTNDGAFWHISCLTDMYINNRGYIEVGLYAKKKKETYGEDDDFLRVYNRNEKYDLFEDYNSSVHKTKIDNYLKERGIEYVCYINYGKSRKVNGNSGLYDDHKFIKARNNIIDLIEVGDYVNGERVIGVKDGWISFSDNSFNKCNFVDSIVTKEQFEAIKYEIN